MDLSKLSDEQSRATTTAASLRGSTDLLVREAPAKDSSQHSSAPVPARWRELLTRITEGQRAPVIIAVFLAIASGVLVPALAFILGRIFENFTAFASAQLSADDLRSRTAQNTAYLAGLGGISWLLNGFAFTVWLGVGELAVFRVRRQLFAALLGKPMEWFDIHAAGMGSFIPRIHSQIRELQLASSQPLGFAVEHFATTVAALGLALYTAWDITLVTISTIPIGVLLLTLTSKRIQPAISKQTELLKLAAGVSHMAFAAIDVVKSHNAQQQEASQYGSHIQCAAAEYIAQAGLNALQIGAVRFLSLSTFVQGFWFGSHLVTNGQRSSGQVLTAFWSCLIATQSFEQILPQSIVLEKGRAAAAAITAILGRLGKFAVAGDKQASRAPGSCEGEVRLCDVSFSYPSQPSHLVLDKASLFFPARETTFLVGRSGSGKSSISNLLLKFYQPRSGAITIDGTSIQDLDTQWLRNNVTVVAQQSVLFNETLFENVILGCKDSARITKDQVKVCIEDASLQDMVLRLPDGLDTIMGLGGKAASGGQRQRVAIARARLRDSPILILDEATSALDQKTRDRVMATLRTWRSGMTTIIITHQLSHIKEQDFVYVLSGGSILREGFRQTLEHQFNRPLEDLLDDHTSVQGDRPPSRLQKRLPPLPSVTAQDPATNLDVQLSRHRSIVPRMYRNTRSPIRTQSRMASLPPVTVHLHRFADNRSSWAPMRKLPCDIGIEESLLQPRPSRENISISSRDSSTSPIRKSQARHAEAQIVEARQSAQALIRAPTSYQKPAIKLPAKAQAKSDRMEPESLAHILGTVWPRLSHRERSYLVFGFLSALIHAIATPVFAWVLSQLLGTFLTTNADRSALALKWSLAILAVAAIDALASYFMHFLLEICGQRWVDSLRMSALQRILDQPRQWHDEDNHTAQELSASLDRDAEEMRNLLGRFAAITFVAAVMVLSAVAWSLANNWQLTLVGLATAPLLYGITRGFEAVSARWEKHCNQAVDVSARIFAETFMNIRTVRALTVEDHFHLRYANAISAVFRLGLRKAVYSGVFFGVSDAAIPCVAALVFWYGGTLVASGITDVQTVVTVFSMLLFSLTNANAIIAFIPQISSSRDTAARVMRLARLPFGMSHEYRGTLPVTDLSGPMVFQNVSFAYPSRPSYPVLDKFNLVLEPGLGTAVVGPSGCGKSTLISLLVGLYPPYPSELGPEASQAHDSGIFIGPHALSQLHLPTWRSIVAYVPQQPVIFPRSLAANITYGLAPTSPFVTAASVARAASLAGLDDLVQSLPEGFATILSDGAGGGVGSDGIGMNSRECSNADQDTHQGNGIDETMTTAAPPGNKSMHRGGRGLSGGQMQRVALARALVRQPRVLILDEPTSALDAISARAIREVLGRLIRSEGLTVIVVTHDRAMMAALDHVVVLDRQGAVVDEGDFASLMSRPSALRVLLAES